LVILTANRQKTTRGFADVALAQNTAGLSALSWLIVILLAAVIIFGLLFYVKRMRRDTPSKKPDRGGFDR
jgi:phosphotransferase system  glucose/maltose/N-acetylglucosamine-specific IIC component